MLEPVEPGADAVIEVLVTRRELIAEEVQQGKVDLVGAVRIGRVHLGLQIRRIVEDEIEDVMALMIVRADEPGIDRNVIEEQRVGHNAFLEPEVLARVSGIEGVDPGFKLLAIAARMCPPLASVIGPDIVVPEQR